MEFTEILTPVTSVGLALLIAGALVTFLSAKITAKMRHKHANLSVKLVGLGIVFAGFALIMFV